MLTFLTPSSEATVVCTQFSFYPATINFPCQAEFSPDNTSCSLCKHHGLVGCCGWPHQKGNSAWWVRHQLIVVVLLLHLSVCVYVCVAWRFVVWLITLGVNAAHSFWLLFRQGIEWEFPKSLMYSWLWCDCFFEEAKCGCGEPRNGHVAIACLLPATDNLVWVCVVHLLKA